MFKSFLYPAVDILSWNVNLYTDVFLFFFPILSRITLTIWGAVTLICGAFIFGQSTTVAVMELLGKIWPLREPSVNKSELFCSSWGQLWLLSDGQQKLNTEDTHTYTPTAFSSMLSMHWDTASKMVLSKIFFFYVNLSITTALWQKKKQLSATVSMTEWKCFLAICWCCCWALFLFILSRRGPNFSYTHHIFLCQFRFLIVVFPARTIEGKRENVV